ncbi:hypothetical protein CSOJ01_05225 [Colletotrichum sojae]|uniref:Uncharacterized protein n=1 Tax=Colletotrichum sojae TaxID=2175907 RepID=A0A8H6JFV0_9PEZI|nr:hypothetical protein CSOJ01_05225 [Colletotrichum sojae]
MQPQARAARGRGTQAEEASGHRQCLCSPDLSKGRSQSRNQWEAAIRKVLCALLEGGHCRGDDRSGWNARGSEEEEEEEEEGAVKLKDRLLVHHRPRPFSSVTVLLGIVSSTLVLPPSSPQNWFERTASPETRRPILVTGTETKLAARPLPAPSLRDPVGCIVRPEDLT